MFSRKGREYARRSARKAMSAMNMQLQVSGSPEELKRAIDILSGVVELDDESTIALPEGDQIPYPSSKPLVSQTPICGLWVTKLPLKLNGLGVYTIGDLRDSGHSLPVLMAPENGLTIHEVKELNVMLHNARIMMYGPRPEMWAMVPIERLDFSVRTFNCLRNGGLVNVDLLSKASEETLFGIRNFGRKSLREVQAALYELGLKF